MRSLLSSLAVTALVLAAGTVRAAEPKSVGQLLNVTGSVEVRRPKERPAKGVLLHPLRAGDVVAASRSGSAEVVLFADGARFSIPGGSSARVEANGLKRVSGSAPKELRRLPLPNPPARTFSKRIMGILVRDAHRRSGGRSTPNGALREAPIVLRWNATGADRELDLRIRDEKEEAFAQRLPAGTREFNVPEGALRAGEYYVYTVNAVNAAGDAERIGIGWFRVLTPPEKTALSVLETETAQERQSNPNSPAAILLLAQTYERFGFLTEARSLYQDAIRMRPNDEGLQSAMQRLNELGR